MSSAAQFAASPTQVGRRIWPALVGPTVWGLHLIVAYFGGAVACGTENDSGWFGESTAGHGFIIAATVVAAVLLLATIAWSFRRRQRSQSHGDSQMDRMVADSDGFVDLIAIGVNLFSLAAVLLEGIWAVMSKC